MVAVFMPVLKLTLGAAWPDHQSHADLPARIQEVSAIFVGGSRLRTILDSMRRPGSSPIISTRQGVENGVVVSTATFGSAIPDSLRCGDKSARIQLPPSPLRRYIPA